MKLLLISFMTLALSIGTLTTAQAESDFGGGFTGESYKAFEDPDTMIDSDMDAAAAAISEIEPAAGDEAINDLQSDMVDQEAENASEDFIEESIDNVIIKSIHQE